MELTFLGTSCMMPTKERNPSAMYLEYKGEGLLFDCAEGTQRQMRIAGLNLAKVNKILVSHWHGDHILGLPGLLLTIASLELSHAVDIYGPRGSKKAFQQLFGGIEFETKFNIHITEVHEGTFYENEDYRLESMPMKHPVPCVGYAFVEKDRRRINVEHVKKLGIPEGPLLGQLQRGETITWKGKKVTPEETTKIVNGKKVVFITDTMPNQNCGMLAANADLLIIDSTYTSKLQDKAEEHGHLTALQAAQIASQASVKKLILTHFSARYKNTLELEEDARTAFDNVFSAYDFMRVNL
ncbi:ribonuclease Z [Candidatus Woesearchaeota archaeon]|nr:ribonuclease Z [Candidatus Woesearchaeota archaeon]